MMHRLPLRLRRFTAADLDRDLCDVLGAREGGVAIEDNKLIVNGTHEMRLEDFAAKCEADLSPPMVAAPGRITIADLGI